MSEVRLLAQAAGGVVDGVQVRERVLY